MKALTVKFQTSDLIPAPYAYAIQLELKADKDLTYQIDLEYLGREDLTEDEIYEEGFTPNDNLNFSGKLPKQWVKELEHLLSKTQLIQKDHLEENEDLWIIEKDGKSLYPKNINQWAEFLEQIRQAILEDQEIERPLEIKVVNDLKESALKASFKSLSLTIHKENKVENLQWSQLLSVLKNIYSGDADYSNASKKLKAGKGIYINFGDGFWFEVGKTYKIKPSKLKMLL